MHRKNMQVDAHVWTMIDFYHIPFGFGLTITHFFNILGGGYVGQKAQVMKGSMSPFSCGCSDRSLAKDKKGAKAVPAQADDKLSSGN